MKRNLTKHELLNAWAKAGHDSKKKKVFVIDDSRSALYLMKVYLDMFPNIETSLFENEIEALSSIADLEPQLLIIDGHLDLFDGLKFREIIKQITPLEIPTIYMSSDLGYKEKLLSLKNESMFLPKPLERSKVLQTIESHIHSGFSLKVA